MNEENREQHYAFDLVRKYEDMLSKNESYYFDTDQFEDIIDYYCDNNKFSQALKVIQYAYTLFPEHAVMLLREAQLLAGMGSLGKALTKLRILERLEPQNDEVYMTMGSIYSQLREHKKAIVLYNKALQYCDEEFSDEVYMEIALEYENMDRFDKAIEILSNALAKNPENESLLYELAYCYDVTDRAEESVSYYKAFIDKYPFSFPAWYNVGNALQKLERMQEAIEAYDYAIAIQEDFVPAYINKAHSLFKMGKYREAIQVFEETYTFEQPQSPVYCYIGECFEKMGEPDKAIFYYRKSLATDDLYPGAYVGLGIVLIQQGQLEEALNYHRYATELDPENVDYHLFYVDALQKLDRHDDAQAIMELLVTKHADNEDVWLDYSDIFFRKNEFEKAIQYLNEGWQKNPQSVALGFRKVAYLVAAGKQNEADELLLRMMMHDPEGSWELGQYYPTIKDNSLFIDLCRQFLIPR
ncbi:MAG: tetratricopeptide repeat protein [Flavobacteriales bacterium]|nr:tetratricopeptide repeat protein [Flavobacteriales bacterium]